MYETIGNQQVTTYTEPITVITLEIIPQKTLDNILVKDIKLNRKWHVWEKYYSYNFVVL